MGWLHTKVEGYLITMTHIMLGIVSVFYALKRPQGPLPIVGSTPLSPWGGPQTFTEADPRPASNNEDFAVDSVVYPASVYELILGR